MVDLFLHIWVEEGLRRWEDWRIHLLQILPVEGRQARVHIETLQRVCECGCEPECKWECKWERECECKGEYEGEWEGE